MTTPRHIKRRRVVAVGTVGVLLALAVVLATSGDDTPTGAGQLQATQRTSSVATQTVRTAPSVAPMPGAHRAPREPVPILMYHVIGNVKPDTPLKGLWVSPAEFRSEVSAVRHAGYNAVTLDQVWKAWHSGEKLPRKPIVFSFDDGYAGQVRDGLPILRRAGWPGVLNLVLHNLRDMGGARAVKRLIAAGWEVDSHTLTHQDLTTLSAADLRRELVGSRTRLRRIFDVPVRFFCYPAGVYNDTVIAAVRAAGYKAATTVEPGWARPDRPFTLPRVRVDGGMGAPALLQRVRDTASH